jgi:hypothetical protein
MFKRNGYQHGCLELKKRKNGPDVWVYRYRETATDKRRVHRSIVIGVVDHYPTKASAQKAAESFVIAANPDNPTQGGVSFRALAGRYKAEELPDLRHSTQLAYSSYLEQHILPKWGDYPLTMVKVLAVEQWLKTLPLAPKTKGNIRNVMRVLIGAAMRWE